jgi:O-antigen/teichoic acid export membrane protein
VIPPSRDTLRAPGARRLFRNSLYVSLGQGSVALLFVTYVLAARILGGDGFGEFSLGLSIATILLMIPAWGSNRYSSIMAARDPDRTGDILATHVGLTLTLAILYIPLVAGVAVLLSGTGPVVWIAVLLAFDLLAREFGNALRLLARVHGEYPMETLTAFGERGSIVVVTLFILFYSPDPVHLAAGFAAGRTLGLLATVLFYRRRVGPIRASFTWNDVTRLFLGGTPIALRRGIGLVTFRVDMLFLGAMRPSREVGWYASIYTIMDGVLMLPQAVNGGIGPTLSANFSSGRKDVITRLYQRGLKYLLIVGVLLAALLGTLAPPIVGIVFGDEYRPAAPALSILSLSVVFLFVRSLATEVLDNVDLRSASAKVFASGLLLNVALNFILIPRLGIAGAAISTVTTEALLMAGMVLALERAGYPADLVRQLRAPLLAILAPLGLLLWLGEAPIPALATSVPVYVVGLALFRAWDEKDVDVFRALLGRLRGRSYEAGSRE